MQQPADGALGPVPFAFLEAGSRDVLVVGRYRASERFTVIAIPKTKIGGEDPTATNASRVDLALGLGGQYDRCERLRIHGEYQ